MSGLSYAEAELVAIVLNDETGQRLQECRHLPPEGFTDAACRTLWGKLVALPAGKTPGLALVGCGLAESDLRRISETPFSSLNYRAHLDTVTRGWIERRAKIAAGAYQRGQIGLSDLAKELAALDTSPTSKIDGLLARAFDPAVDPPKPRVIYRLGRTAICTAGNLSCLAAEAKAGKSAFAGAMIAAPWAGAGADCLTVSAENPNGHALLHFDTEQSRGDWHQLLCRIKRRARVENFPVWLRSYHLTGLSANECRDAVEMMLEHERRRFGGIFAMFIDGIADLVLDPNDGEECFPLVMRLHDLAIRYDTAIINVLHRNPNSEKTRGHLGSQLERKAETNLTLKKDKDDKTVVFSTRQRGQPIPESDGPRFRWSDGDGMHVTCETVRASRDRQKAAELLELGREVFAGHQFLHYSEIKKDVMRIQDVSDRTADDRVTEMNRLGVIVRHPPNLYRLAG